MYISGLFERAFASSKSSYQTHKITEKAELDQLMRQSIPLIEESYSQSETESSSGSETEDEESLIKRLGSEEFGNDNDIFEEDSDGELDWLAKNYTSLLTQDPYQNQRSSDSDLDRDSQEGEEQLNKDNISADDIYDYEDIEEKFVLSSNEEDEMISEFQKWLSSVAGGRKKPNDIKKMRNTLMSIVRHNGSREINYNYLASPSFLNSWMTKLTDEKKEPGTIKTYLNSVKHFIDFCEAEDNDILVGQNIPQVRVLICKWRNTFYKEAQEREYEKELEAMDNFPTPEEVLQFDESETVLSAKKLILKAQVKGFRLTKQNYCHVRDYLLTRLIFDNASRPGALSNMTLKEFERAIFRNNGHVISVKKHKTGYKGPAHIACNKGLFKELIIFKNYFRNKLDDISIEPEDTFFVSWNGGAMDSSLITTQMGSYWRRALNKDISKINPTLVRKYTTSTVHEHVPDSKQKTANLLCHSLRMAESKYAIFNKQKSAVGASNMVKDVQRRSFEQIVNYDEIPFEHIFKQYIEKGAIKIADVREVVAKEDVFNNFTIDEAFLKKVCDSIRYIIKTKTQQTVHCERAFDNAEESEDEVTEKIPRVAIVSEAKDLKQVGHVRSRKTFSESELNLIYEHLGHFIDSREPLIKSDFLKYVSSKKELETLVAKFGMNSLLVKMRTERKHS